MGFFSTLFSSKDYIVVNVGSIGWFLKTWKTFRVKKEALNYFKSKIGEESELVEGVSVDVELDKNKFIFMRDISKGTGILIAEKDKGICSCGKVGVTLLFFDNQYKCVECVEKELINILLGENEYAKRQV